MNSSFTETEGKQCLLLAGRGAWLAQVCLFVFGCSVVTAQWRSEPASRRRAPRVFCTDALTLAFGSVCAHFLNLLFVVHASPSGQHSEQEDQCAAYVVFYILDFAVSTPLYFLLFQLLWAAAKKARCCWARRNAHVPLDQSEALFTTRLAWRKSVCWTSAVCLGKAVVFALFWSTETETRRLTASVGRAWEYHLRSELWLSTFGVPVVLNSLQLLATSFFLGKESQNRGISYVDDDEQEIDFIQ